MPPRYSNAIWIVLAVVSLVLFLLLAVVVSTHSVGHPTIVAIDRATQGSISAAVHPSIARTALFFTYLANAQFLIIAQVVLLIVLFLLRRKELSFFLVGSLIIGELASISIKDILARGRPDELLYIVSRSGYSFPSGHALAATIFYGFVGYSLVRLLKVRWQKDLVVILSAILILLIGFSRIVLGVHWLSDVVGGLLLGFGLLSLAIFIFGLVHDHIDWQTLSFPRGFTLFLVLVLVGFLSFFVFYYYVTHPLVIRSISISG
jgi:undecaprenyl-diphosphatase